MKMAIGAESTAKVQTQPRGKVISSRNGRMPAFALE